MASDEASWRLVGENRVVGVKRAGRKSAGRKKATAVSSSGSESAIVGKDPAIDQVTKKKKKTRSKGLPQTAPTAGKRLMPHEEVMAILCMKDEPRESDTAGAEDRKVVAEWLEFQEEVMREYMAKSYVEMDEYFVERERKELLLQEEWDKIDFGGLVFLDSDDDSYVRKDEGGPRWEDGIVQE